MADMSGRLGGALRRLLVRVDRRRLGPETLERILGELGVRSGRTVLVHSSMDEVGRRLPGVDALRVIDLLRGMVGESGTLLMPTSPFVGSQEEYARGAPTFDVRRTPSRLGLLTEVFRRQPGVTRSRHPTHSVAGLGPRARELLSQHHLGTTFGPTSPFHKLAFSDGLIVGLGVGMRQAFTIWHVVEELHPPTRRRVFAREGYPLEVIDGADRYICRCHPLRANVRRDFGALERALLGSGALKYRRPGGLLVAAAEGRDFVAAGLAHCEQSAAGWRRRTRS